MSLLLQNYISNADVFNTIKSLCLPQLSFTGSSSEYKCLPESYSAIDLKNLLIRLPHWANNTLELDDFSINVNKNLLEYQNERSFWDYEIIDFLIEKNYDKELLELLESDYSYNFDNFLERDIHYTLFNYDSENYICFSVHYGADARVGFSDCLVFRIIDLDYFHDSLLINAYDYDSDNEINIYDLEDIAFYNEIDDEWYLNETNKVIRIYSSADGF